MPKPKTPALADWLVTFLDPRTNGTPVKIRATYLDIRGGVAYLEDTAHSPLFCAPAAAVHIRRLEPGEDTAADEKVTEPPADPAPPAKPAARRTRG